MRLIRKSGLQSRQCERCAATDECPCLIQPPQCQIAVGAGAEQGPEIARELPAVLPRRLFEVLQGNRPPASLPQKVACHVGRPAVRRTYDPGGRRLSGGLQGKRQIINGIIVLQRLHRRADVADEAGNGPEQPWIAADATGHERQRLMRAERSLHKGRIEVEHPVMEAVFGSRLTIVQLIGMNDHRRAWKALAHTTPVPELLHTGQCAADGIGVMPVRLIRRTREIGLYALAAFHSGRQIDPARSPAARRLLQLARTCMQGLVFPGHSQPVGQSRKSGTCSQSSLIMPPGGAAGNREDVAGNRPFPSRRLLENILASVTEGFGEVDAGDGGVAVEVGEGAGEFEDAVIATGAEGEAVGRIGEELAA